MSRRPPVCRLSSRTRARASLVEPARKNLPAIPPEIAPTKKLDPDGEFGVGHPLVPAQDHDWIRRRVVEAGKEALRMQALQGEARYGLRRLACDPVRTSSGLTQVDQKPFRFAQNPGYVQEARERLRYQDLRQQAEAAHSKRRNLPGRHSGVPCEPAQLVPLSRRFDNGRQVLMRLPSGRLEWQPRGVRAAPRRARCSPPTPTPKMRASSGSSHARGNQ